MVKMMESTGIWATERKIVNGVWRIVTVGSGRMVY